MCVCSHAVGWIIASFHPNHRVLELWRQASKLARSEREALPGCCQGWMVRMTAGSERSLGSRAAYHSPISLLLNDTKPSGSRNRLWTLEKNCFHRWLSRSALNESPTKSFDIYEHVCLWACMVMNMYMYKHVYMYVYKCILQLFFSLCFWTNENQLRALDKPLFLGVL